MLATWVKTLYRLIYMLSMLYVRLTIKVKVGIPESFKVGWYPHKITWSSHLKQSRLDKQSRLFQDMVWKSGIDYRVKNYVSNLQK